MWCWKYLCLCYTLCVDVTPCVYTASLPFVSAQFVCSLWPTGDNPFSPQDFRSFRTSISILFDLKKSGNQNAQCFKTIICVSFTLKGNQVNMASFTFFIQNLVSIQFWFASQKNNFFFKSQHSIVAVKCEVFSFSPLSRCLRNNL